MRRRIVTITLAAVLGMIVPAGGGQAQTIAEKAQVCAACHGEAGIPLQKTFPVIWGQYQGYLYLQLRDYKSGARKNDIMSPLAQTLERDDMMALALYFSQKHWPDLQQPSAPADVRATRQGVCNFDLIFMAALWLLDFFIAKHAT